MKEKMYTLLDKINEKVMGGENAFALLSEFGEWNAEMAEYLLKEYGHWNGVVEDGEIRLGRLFYKIFDWKYYNQDLIPGEEEKPVPFHCYAINDRDVVFTKKTLQWSDAEQQYVGKEADIFRALSTSNYLLRPTSTESNSTTSSQSENQGCASIILVIIILTATITMML